MNIVGQERISSGDSYSVTNVVGNVEEECIECENLISNMRGNIFVPEECTNSTLDTCNRSDSGAVFDDGSEAEELLM